jgi:hypothetical protein
MSEENLGMFSYSKYLNLPLNGNLKTFRKYLNCSPRLWEVGVCVCVCVLCVFCCVENKRYPVLLGA